MLSQFGKRLTSISEKYSTVIQVSDNNGSSDLLSLVFYLSSSSSHGMNIQENGHHSDNITTVQSTAVQVNKKNKPEVWRRSTISEEENWLTAQYLTISANEIAELCLALNHTRDLLVKHNLLRQKLNQLTYRTMPFLLEFSVRKSSTKTFFTQILICTNLSWRSCCESCNWEMKINEAPTSCINPFTVRVKTWVSYVESLASGYKYYVWPSEQFFDAALLVFSWL